MEEPLLERINFLKNSMVEMLTSIQTETSFSFSLREMKSLETVAGLLKTQWTLNQSTGNITDTSDMKMTYLARAM